MREFHRFRSRTLLLLAFLAGCSALSLEGVATPENDARAQRILRAVVAGEHDSVLQHARFGDDTVANAAGLAALDSALRGRSIDSLQLIGANRFSFEKHSRLTLTYEFRNDSGWIGATVTTDDSADAWALLGLHAEPLPGELQAINRFTLSGRGITQYAGLLLVVLCTLMSVGMAVFIATRRTYPKRWRWVAASLVGVSAVFINWTTGEVSTRMLTMQLFSSTFARPNAYAPWILSFSFPLGAIVALQRYRQWKLASTRTILPAAAPEEMA